MAKYSEIQEQRLRMVIRDAMAINPLITLSGLQQVTEKKAGRALSRDYIIKLQRKVRGEVQIRPDRERYEKRLAEVREKNRIIIDELFRIAFPDPNTPAHDKPGVIDRRKALETIARIIREEVKLEMDLGLFTKHLGQFDVEHRLKPLDDNTLNTIATTFKAWSTPPVMRKLEPKRIIEAQAKEIPNEPPKPPTTPNSAQPNAIPVTTGAGLVTSE